MANTNFLPALDFVQLMQGDYGSKLLGPKDDFNTADKIDFDGKNIKLTYPNRSKQPNFTEQRSLESIPGTSGGVVDRQKSIYDMMSKLSSQGQLTVDDLSGLGAQEIGMLMQGEQNAMANSQRTMSDIMSNRMQGRKLAAQQEQNRKTAEAKVNAATLTRKQKVDDAKQARANVLTDQGTALDNLKSIAKYRDDLSNILTPEEAELATVELDLLKKELAGAKTDEEKAKAKADLDLVLQRTESLKQEKIASTLPKEKFDHQKILDQDKREANILDPSKPFLVSRSLAQDENIDPKSRKVYVITDPAGGDDYIPWNETGGDIQAFQIPKEIVSFAGKPATGAEVIRRAEAANMTVPEYLKALLAIYNR